MDILCRGELQSNKERDRAERQIQAQHGADEVAERSAQELVERMRRGLGRSHQGVRRHRHPGQYPQPNQEHLVVEPTGWCAQPRE